MMRRLLLASLFATIPLSACSRRQPPPQPEPDPPPPATQPPTTQPQPPAADPDAEARRRAEESARALAILEEIVHFDYDESTIRADAQEALARKVPILRANPGVQLRVVGHTDERGSVEYNLALGMRRANAVRDYLAGFGIDASRFVTTSMGEDVPLDPGSNERAWALNRRAEFTVAGGQTLILPGS
ncbi:MAG TPA: OmpA family protein [Longimicrobiales bacterium]|nr:OmpA family protein [Longimicrobiales bacterium]